MDERVAEDRDYWDRMAGTWERHLPEIQATSQPVMDWLVDRLDLKPGDVLLDLAAGAGDVGFAAAGRVGPEGKVITADLSPEMLALARRRARELALQNVEVRVMDAHALDLADDSVDGVACRWGFMLMPEPERALAEARRVLRPGGRLAFSVWGPPERNPWLVMLGMLLLQRGRIELEDPTAPGGIFSMGSRERIERPLALAGFSLRELEEMPLGWRFPDFETFWRYETEMLGPLADAIRDMPAREVEEVRGDLGRLCEGFRVDDGYRIPALTINVLAV